MNIYNEPADLFVASFIGNPAMNFITTVLTEDNLLCSEKTGIKIPLPKVFKPALANQTGKTIILGIRPQDLSTRQEYDEKYQFDASVELIEPLGNETILYLLKGPQSISCVSEHYYPGDAESDQITISINPEKIHLFDGSTSKRILPGN